MAVNDDLDPDTNFTQLQNLNDMSQYIEEGALNSFIQNPGNASFTCLHINSRSLKKNHNSVTNLISRLSKQVSVIAISETWLMPSHENLFQINGYNFVCKSRNAKIGGGVGLYLDCDLNFSNRNDLSFIKDAIECIFVEIN